MVGPGRRCLAGRAVAASAGGTGPDDEKPEEHAEKAEERSSKESRFYRPIDRTYTKLLRWSMAHRWIILGLCVLVVLSIVQVLRTRQRAAATVTLES